MLSIALAVLSLGTPAASPTGPADVRSPALSAPDTVPRDTARARRNVNVGIHARPPARQMRAATPEVMASAYRDPHARAVIARARAARLTMDSSLASYDARAVQRISAGMSLRENGRQRLVFRSEKAWRVRWQRGVGARAEVLGSRSIVPMVSRSVGVDDDMGDVTIPYYPGREGLLFFSGVQKVNDTTDVYLVHPLDDGSEAAYRFASGDSTVIRLPDGSRVRLVEVRVEARRPDPDLLVGSLWFDEGSGQLVRAAFRPAAPLDLSTEMADDGDDDRPTGIVGTMLNPMVFSSEGFFVEYGLHKGRWWMPHSQGMTGLVRVGVMRLPVRLEERFEYADVNGTLAMAPIAKPDGPAHDSTVAHRDTIRFGDGKRRSRQCDEPGQVSRTVVTTRYEGTLPVEVTIPCDTAVLLHSAQLPGSIYTPDEELFGTEARKELEAALGFGLQPGWGPGRPRVTYGFGNGLLRYNRVEGLAPAVQVDETLGMGYSAMARLRAGTSAPVPTGELAVTRAAGARSLSLGIFRRLDAANDWGDPLGFGASLSALLFGRDEGFYYRAWGAELSGRRGPSLDWRLFGERQTGAERETSFSLAHTLGADGFGPNIDADRADVAGGALTLRHTFGARPGGFQLATSTRAEGAGGRFRGDTPVRDDDGFRYLRGMTDVTATHGLGRRLDVALTGAAGTSAGTVPVQRLWYLGGAYTVRGQPAGTAAGDAFWLGRVELGSSFAAARPVVFFDAGWAGSRRDWSHTSAALRGVGAGVSFLDGMVRFDLSRGLAPTHSFRADAYLEARF
jgi:hypothetical protein